MGAPAKFAQVSFSSPISSRLPFSSTTRSASGKELAQKRHARPPLPLRPTLYKGDQSVSQHSQTMDGSSSISVAGKLSSFRRMNVKLTLCTQCECAPSPTRRRPSSPRPTTSALPSSNPTPRPPTRPPSPLATSPALLPTLLAVPSARSSRFSTTGSWSSTRPKRTRSPRSSGAARR